MIKDTEITWYPPNEAMLAILNRILDQHDSILKLNQKIIAELAPINYVVPEEVMNSGEVK